MGNWCELKLGVKSCVVGDKAKKANMQRYWREEGRGGGVVCIAFFPLYYVVFF